MLGCVKSPHCGYQTLSADVLVRDAVDNLLPVLRTVAASVRLSWWPGSIPVRPNFSRRYTQGWPIFLLAEASLHTQNIKANAVVSLLCQTPREGNGQSVRPAIAFTSFF